MSWLSGKLLGYDLPTLVVMDFLKVSSARTDENYSIAFPALQFLTYLIIRRFGHTHHPFQWPQASSW